MAGSTYNACRVALVHHNQCIVLLCQVTDLVHGSHVAVHREHTVGHDDAEALSLSLLKALLQFLHVGIGIAIALCLAQAHTVDDGCMVQSIGNDSVLVGQKRFEHTTVGIKASSIEDGILGLEVLADLCLQYLVYVSSTADEANATHTETTGVQCLLGSLDKTRMIGKTKVVVSTEVQHFLASHLDFCLLGALYQTLVLVKSCFLNLCQSLAKMLFHFSVHSQLYFRNYCYYDPKLRFFVQMAKLKYALFPQISLHIVYKRKDDKYFSKKKLINTAKCLYMQKHVWRLT